MSYNQIKSFEDACKALNMTTDLPDFSMLSAAERQAMTDHYKLTVITRALNGGWTPDWNNSDEYKYYPWFYCKGGFSFGGVDFSYSNSHVGSRLCFLSEEIAEYAATQFIDLYKSYFTVNQ